MAMTSSSSHSDELWAEGGGCGLGGCESVVESVRAVRGALVKSEEKHLTMKGRKWWRVTLASCWNEASS